MEAMPHEPSVRAWLRRSRLSQEDIDEVIQDCYCRFAMLDSVEHIERADAYFFTMARNIMTRRMKRQKIVPIESLTETEVAGLIDETPSPERHAAARLEIGRLRSFLVDLPERCRRIIELRKFGDLPQKEIAKQLGVTESIVENDLIKGMLVVQEAWRAVHSETDREALTTSEKGQRS